METTSTLLAGRYRLDEPVGRGASADVWRGFDTRLDRTVAVKLLRPEHRGDQLARARLRAEARHAALLRHPNVAQVYDLGDADIPFLVLEYVPGEQCSALLARTGPWPAERVLRLLEQVADALAAAHGAGLVHLDVKPGNLIVLADDTVKVTDFGIAARIGGENNLQPGMVLGTPRYLAPEQASGAAATAASDVYSLGVVAYECLAGHCPFGAEDAESLAAAHVHEPPPALPPSVPAPVAALVSAMLAKDPLTRPSAAEVRDRAARLAREASPAGATQPYPVEPQPMSATTVLPPVALPTQRRRPRWLPVALLAVLAVALASGLWWLGVGAGSGSAARHVRAAQPAAHHGAATPVHPVGIRLLGSPDGHENELPLAIDGNPATAWYTQHYATAAFGNLRSGLGLIVDLGHPVTVRAMHLLLAVPGVALSVHAGDNPATLLQAPTLAASSAAPARLSVRGPAHPARYWLVWFTRLAPSDGAYRAGVAEISFTG